MNEIFLSYRRSDEPGYVGRLADSLERVFGENTVFRDVDSVRAHEKWKISISKSVTGAQVIIAVIGPAWQKLLTSWPDEERDWVRFELNEARRFEIPVLVVELAKSGFDHSQNLEDLAWLNDIEFFELADGQGRWDTDIARLADDITKVTKLKVSCKDGDIAGSNSQTTHGDKSPIVNTGGGNSVIKF